MATRSLTWDDGITQRDVLVRMWAPVPDGQAFACDFAIDGLPEPVRGSAMGVDLLQAVVLALTSLRTYLQPHEASIAWLDKRGEHGIPMQIAMEDRQERRRLESLVESDIDAFYKRQLEPFEDKRAELAARIDPSSRDVTSGEWSTEDLIAELTSACARMREAHMKADATAQHFFSTKRWRILGALRARSDHEETLQRLSNSDDPSLRFLGAMRLELDDRAVLAQTRDEGVEPEATEAASILTNIERGERRRKAWEID